MSTLAKTILSAFLLLFFLAKVECASSEEAALDIQSAIQASIIDGLTSIDQSMRAEYWYYLRGSDLLTYNASIKSDRLNYILLYNLKSSVYRVNCDLTFQRWTPELNSFVQLVVAENVLSAIKNNVQLLSFSDHYLDLTNSILSKNTTTSTPYKSLSVAATPTPTPSQSSGITILYQKPINLSTNT